MGRVATARAGRWLCPVALLLSWMGEVAPGAAAVPEEDAARIADVVQRLRSMVPAPRDAAAGAVEELVWRGRASQLGGKWADAAALYGKAADALETQARAAAGLAAGAGGAGGDDAIEAALAKPGNAVGLLLARRASLLILAAKLQRGLLNDPEAASATLIRALAHPAVLMEPSSELLRLREQVLQKLLDERGRARKDAMVPRGRALGGVGDVLLAAMRELAMAQEQAGKVRDAIETLSRVALLRVTYSISRLPDDVQWLASLVQLLPPGSDVPDTGLLTLLTPEQPSVAFGLGEARSLARTSGFALTGGANPHWVYFAVAPPPGLEFSEVTVEQEGPGTPYHAYRTIAFSNRDGPTTYLVGDAKQNELPPGTGVFTVSFAPKPELAAQQRLRLTAAFRRRGVAQANPRDLPWVGRERAQVGNERPKSAFQWQETTLRGFGPGEPAHFEPHASLARLPDGRWLAVYATGTWEDRWLMQATSHDLVTWDTPQRVPVASVFAADAPALMRDTDGTVWLAYLCDCLGLGRINPAAIWLTSTRDARNWARPSPVLAPHVGSGKTAPVQMLRAPDGRYWIFHLHRSGSAESLGQVRQLENMTVPWRTHEAPLHPFYAIDAAGKFHAAVSEYAKGLLHTTSADGRAWGPTKLVAATRELHRFDFIHPQLLLRGNRALVVYESAQADWFRRGRLGPDGLRLGEPQPITHFLARMNSARVHVTENGELVTFAGQGIVWLLRARLDQLIEPVADF